MGVLAAYVFLIDITLKLRVLILYKFICHCFFFSLDSLSRLGSLIHFSPVL